jgi:predicted GNAT family acetyltransferase
VVMVHRGDPPAEPAHAVRGLEAGALRDARIRAFEEDLGTGAAGQVAAALELAASVAAASCSFAVEADGAPVSWCVLYQENGIGQIDDVVTNPAYRRRGYAKAVVAAATRRSIESDDQLTFLVADDEDWPKEMYARLGFEPIGRRYEFTRL